MENNKRETPHPDCEMYIDNVYPIQYLQPGGLDGAPPKQVILPGVTLLDYYLAAAPPAPDWYVNQVTDDNMAANQETEGEVEPVTDMEIEIRWRFTFAKNMILERTSFLTTNTILANPDQIIE